MEIHYSTWELACILLGSTYLIGCGLARLVEWAWNRSGRIFGPQCSECGKYPADSPSSLCTGCDAYQDHTSIY